MDMKEAMKAAGVRPHPPGDLFFDQNGNLKLEFVAKATVEPLARKLGQDRLTMSQLRRFFLYCRNIERRIRSRQTTWEQEKARVAKLSAFAADAAGKRPPKIPLLFRDFIDQKVKMVQSEKDFLEGFMEHFEALVGFAALHLREEKRR